MRKRLVRTQEELAAQLGMSTSNIRRIERSEKTTIGPKYIRKLAEISGKSLDAMLVTISVNGLSSAPSGILLGSDVPTKEIEIFHGVSAARVANHAPVVRSGVGLPAKGSREFAVVVDGDCMEPVFSHGDIVVFSVDEAEKRGIVDGKSYFIRLDGEENTFKRIFIDTENLEQLILKPYNEKYSPRIIMRSQVTLLAMAIRKLVNVP